MKSLTILQVNILRLFLFAFITFTLPITIFSQTQRSISGTVFENETNTPLSGVTIYVKGTSRSTSTNELGKYTISATANDVIIITFVGYSSQEIPVSGRSTINVTLMENANDNDVVVTGYRTLLKQDFTGSVAQISGEELQKSPVANFSQALEGRIPGLQVQFEDGQPGQSGTFILRGPGSLNNSPEPLFVVDGFQLENFNPASLNTDDIESVTFLKDASSVAIYGSRAANGVVIITTKRGRASAKPQIAFNGSYGFNANRKKMELMSAYEYVKLQMLWFPNDPYTKKYINDTITLEDYKNKEIIDFQDYIYTRGKVQRYNASMRGGNENTRYLISGSYFDQEGSIINTGSKSYTARLTLDNNISKRVKLNINADYATTLQTGPYVRDGNGQAGGYSTSTTLMYRVWGWRPVPYPEEAVDDLLLDLADESSITTSDLRINPVVDYENQNVKRLYNYFNGNAALTINILKNLSFRSTFIDRYSVYNYEAFYNENTSQGYFSYRNALGPFGVLSNSRTNSITNENILTYDPQLGKDNKLTIMAIQGALSSNTKVMGYASPSENALPFPSMGIYGLDEGKPYAPVSAIDETSRIWYASRIDYSYKSKYVVNLTGRAEASSKFAPGHRWGFFPSFGVAWNMEKESFLKNAKAISLSKIRFTLGSAGNDRISNYSPFEKFDFTNGSYPFNNTVTDGSVYQSSPSNENISWETMQTMDLGYELGLFKNRINLEASVYKKTTKNLLYNAYLPLSSGFTRAWKNIGSLENRGLELELRTINIKNKDFEWRSSFNISFNKNKIIELTDNLRSLFYGVNFESNFNDLYVQRIGEPSGMMIGYVWDGLYKVEDFYNPAPNIYILKEGIPINNPSMAVAPGYIKYKDLNGDGIINQSDLTIIGRGQPIHFGGFGNNFNYKGLSLFVLFSWVYGNNIYNANLHTFEGNSNLRPYLNQFKSYENRWTFENQDTEIPRAVTTTAGRTGYYNSKYVEDGSFLRLKTINLDYALPVKWTKQIGFTGLSIYLSAQNVATWTNYSGLDPQVSVSGNEVLGPGFDYSAYPPPMTFTLGLKGTL